MEIASLSQEIFCQKKKLVRRKSEYDSIYDRPNSTNLIVFVILCDAEM